MMRYIIYLLFFNFIFSETRYINSVTIKGNFSNDKNEILKIINTKNPKIFFHTQNDITLISNSTYILYPLTMAIYIYHSVYLLFHVP